MSILLSHNIERCNNKNFYVEELSDPPPSYSHRAGSYAINSTEYDVDLAPGAMSYGSTQSAVVNVSSTRALLGEQAHGNVHDLVQGYQEVVFSCFVFSSFFLDVVHSLVL